MDFWYTRSHEGTLRKHQVKCTEPTAKADCKSPFIRNSRIGKSRVSGSKLLVSRGWGGGAGDRGQRSGEDGLAKGFFWGW